MEYSCLKQPRAEDVNYQLRVSKSSKRQMLLMSVVVVNVLSDLGVKSISAEAQLLSSARFFNL